jgi:SAM-dependent methyltransferase
MNGLTFPSQNLAASRYQFALYCLRDLKAELPSNVVFDIGPGNSTMRYLQQFGFVWRGFDQTAWGDVLKWDLIDPCPMAENSAGAVILLDVIEHCTNPGLALKNIAAALKNEGRLILTTPNPRWSGSRIHHAVFGTLSDFTRNDLDDNHHVLPIWPHVLEKMLDEAEMVVDDYVTLDGKTKLL